MRKTAVVVGNGTLPGDRSQTIDAADFIVRFNEPKLSVGLSGTRTDLLILATSSKPMQRRLNDLSFTQSPTFKAAREVMLAYHPSIIRKYHPKPNILSQLKGRRSDWTEKTIEIVGGAGKEIRIMPPQFYLAGCAELGLSESEMHTIFPSTGYFGIRYVLQMFPPAEWDIKLCGFSWEGWKRHSWDAEKQWVERNIATGKTSILE
ncbi:hypothetical protein [Phyllobacterium sp. SB3]|uniref:hypothetical protein n=1 Tax=Phyllobacterium sp. SB3 TaxID=3156073 RepID=UPI0032AF4E71